MIVSKSVLDVVFSTLQFVKKDFDKLSTHSQNFHKSSENAVIENERHP